MRQDLCIEWSKRRKARGIYEFTGVCGQIVKKHTLVLSSRDRPSAADIEGVKRFITDQFKAARRT